MRILDISPVVSEKTAVFPGDHPFSRDISLDFEKGHNLLLSSIHSTVHVGAHVDAPNHYHPQGAPISERSLHYYVGPCQVVRVEAGPGERLLPRHLGSTRLQAKRVLFKTGSFPDPNRWNSDFNSLSAELVSHLARQGVILVGIDTPSVDPAEDKELEAHQAIFQNDMANLEGVVLHDVPEGIYTLLALPLRLEGADASPVRAVLVEGAIQ